MAAGTIAEDEVEDLLLIAAVWVDPAADSEEEVFANNRDATVRALARGRAGEPSIGQVRDAAEAGPANPFFRQRSRGE